MTYSTRMIACSSLRAEHEALQVDESDLDPDITTKIAVRLSFLNPSEKTDINLAADYCLSGKYAYVLAVLDPAHPMADIFTIRGEAKDKRIVEYLRKHLKKQDLREEVSKLEKVYC
jgi:hypothetical protein